MMGLLIYHVLQLVWEIVRRTDRLVKVFVIYEMSTLHTHITMILQDLSQI